MKTSYKTGSLVEVPLLDLLNVAGLNLRASQDICGHLVGMTLSGGQTGVTRKMLKAVGAPRNSINCTVPKIAWGDFGPIAE